MNSCATKYCHGIPVGIRKKCQRCRMREWREKNPMQHTYNNLKYGAKRRGVVFTLTFSQWRHFCEFTNYIGLRGPGKDDMTVDRLDNSIGYVFGDAVYKTIGKWSGWVFGNIRMITRRQNSKEGIKSRRAPYIYKPDAVPDVPF